MSLKIVLIGGSGQLGAEFRAQAPATWRIVSPLRAEIDLVDFVRLDALVRQERPDAVVNFGALHLIDVCEADFELALKTNAVSVSTLAKAARDVGARFLTVSTDYVFDGRRNSPYPEDHPTSPIQNYGISKATGERAAIVAHPEGAFVVRTCGLYGATPGAQKGNFVANRLKDAIGAQRIEVGSDLVCTPTSAFDLAAFVVHVLGGEADPGLYNFTNSGSCNWAEFTAEIYRLAGLETTVVPVDRQGHYGTPRPVYTVLSCERVSEVGFRIRSWQAALAHHMAILSASKGRS